MDENDLYRRAIAAYYRSAKDGERLDQPSEGLSGYEFFDERDYLVLRNAAQILAVYRVRKDNVLRRMRRWPKGLEYPGQKGE